MKRQSNVGIVEHVAKDAANLAVVGAEIVGAGVVLTAGIVAAAAELSVARLLMSEKKKKAAPATKPRRRVQG